MTTANLAPDRIYKPKLMDNERVQLFVAGIFLIFLGSLTALSIGILLILAALPVIGPFCARPLKNLRRIGIGVEDELLTSRRWLLTWGLLVSIVGFFLAPIVGFFFVISTLPLVGRLGNGVVGIIFGH